MQRQIEDAISGCVLCENGVMGVDVRNKIVTRLFCPNCGLAVQGGEKSDTVKLWNVLQAELRKGEW